jgi:hypothetical protein
MDDFHTIKTAVADRYNALRGRSLFRTAIDGDELWAAYLAAFPEGTNPLYRKRSEHDCSCCRQFVKSVGNVVAVIDGHLESIWDVTTGSNTYDAVADALASLVKSRSISDRFLSPSATAGTDRNFETVPDGVKSWHHFYVAIGNTHVCDKKDLGTRLGDARALHDVMLRSLAELTLDAADTVLDLIAQGSLYRGDEQRFTVNAFRSLKEEFDKLSPERRDTFAWVASCETTGAVSKIRNTAIGTMLIDLSARVELETAVRKFEAVVAPANYKRPTALVTPAMVAKAREKIEELGLTSALDRRYATLLDVPVTDALFVDRGARRKQAPDVFDDVAAAATVKPRAFDKVEEVGIEKFLADVLSRARAVEVLVENRSVGNLVSLIAPGDPAAGRLFKWANGLSWSYNGDLADSVKERVKRAGGNVTGDLCCRLAWSNYDDLDLHMTEPGHEIFYAHKVSPKTGGQLDVDMNAGGRHTREPVENIFYPSMRTMTPGVYTLVVHQFSQRETDNVGFDVEIDVQGSVYRFTYPKALTHDERVKVAKLRYSHESGIEIIESLPASTVSKAVWGLPTQQFHSVSAITLSPNHWDGHGVGNKHYFFMLDGCVNDGSARGFYNEFLNPDLDQHRRVFELVGAKVRTVPDAAQLSGLGFSSTRRDHVVVRVTGATKRVIKVMF